MDLTAELDSPFLLMRLGVKKLWTVKPGSLTGHCLHMLSRFQRIRSVETWTSHYISGRSFSNLKTKWLEWLENFAAWHPLLQKLPELQPWNLEGERIWKDMKFGEAHAKWSPGWDRVGRPRGKRFENASESARCASFVIAPCLPNAALGPGDLQLIRQIWVDVQDEPKGWNIWNHKLWSKPFELELFLYLFEGLFQETELQSVLMLTLLQSSQ